MEFVLISRYYWADRMKENEVVGNVTCMGEGRNLYRVLVVKPEGKGHLEDQGVDGRMGSKWTLGRLVGGVWSGFSSLSIGTVGGLL
jgi:hypothetical protein